jgi:hypothetical protein
VIERERRPYQLDGSAWLLPKDNAALGDQPGLGKTIQILDSHPKDHGLAIVCPKSAKSVWRKEIDAWGIDLRVTVLQGVNSWRAPKPGECVILNYAILPWTPAQIKRAREAGKKPGPAIGDCDWPVHVVADECQALRKSKSLQTTRFRALMRKCAKVTGSTGTPVGGTPFDLYHMLSALGCCPWSWPVFLRRFHAFELPHGGYDYARDSSGAILVDPRVKHELAAVMLRRLRVDVAAELPAKLYQRINCDHKRATTAELDRIGKVCAPYFDRDELPPFTEFAQVARMIADERIPLLKERLDLREEHGEIGLVLSAHRAPVEAAGARPGWGAIHGGTPEPERERLIDAFEAGQLRGLAIVLQTAATAISLPSADYEIFVDRSWDPDLNEQAEDRANRLNRTKGPIQIEIWTSDHPVSRHLERVLAMKKALASAVLGE